MTTASAAAGQTSEISSETGSETSAPSGLKPYDAVVLVSFGGPEKPADVLPFLQNVTRGRGIPDERLVEVGRHYDEFGGRSPINDQCRALLAALRSELDARGLDVPLYWGNRNWEPYLTDTVAEMAAAGHRRVLAVITSAYPSYSSCRQYRENLYDAVTQLGQGTDPATGLVVDRLRHYSQDPAFVAANTRAVLAALDTLPGEADAPAGREPARLVFVTHAIPTAMAVGSGPPPRSDDGGYVDWHRAVADEIVRQVSSATGREFLGDLVFCSRSGPPGQPWTEPDVNDHLTALRSEGVRSVVVAPIGFISDHMEVIYDLDTEAAATAAELGLEFARAATAGVDPQFVSGLVDLALERARAARGEAVEPVVIPGGRVGPYACVPGCCPNLRQPDRLALCGQDAPSPSTVA